MRFKLLAMFLPCLLFAVGYEEPWGKDADLHVITEDTPPPSHSWGVRLAGHIIRFHQTVLSPVDGPRSHFRPSSSAYMKDAMHKHGFFLGFALGCDRLMRENSDPWVYRTIEAEGQLFKHNPVPPLENRSK